MQWHFHCLLQQYLLTKPTNLGRSAASANANTAFLARAPNGKESESVGSLGIAAVHLLPFTHSCAPELTNLSFRICLTRHQLSGSCSLHYLSTLEKQKTSTPLCRCAGRAREKEVISSPHGRRPCDGKRG